MEILKVSRLIDYYIGKNERDQWVFQISNKGIKEPKKINYNLCHKVCMNEPLEKESDENYVFNEIGVSASFMKYYGESPEEKDMYIIEIVKGEKKTYQIVNKKELIKFLKDNNRDDDDVKIYMELADITNTIEDERFLFYYNRHNETYAIMFSKKYFIYINSELINKPHYFVSDELDVGYQPIDNIPERLLVAVCNIKDDYLYNKEKEIIPYTENKFEYINENGVHGLLYNSKKYMDGMEVAIDTYTGKIKFGSHVFNNNLHFGFYIKWYNKPHLRNDLIFFLKYSELEVLT